MYLDYDRLISFASVHHAIRGERLLAEARIKVVALPTPRELDISCGQCLLFKTADEPAVLKTLQDGQVQWSKLFKRDGRARAYEKLAEN